MITQYVKPFFTLYIILALTGAIIWTGRDLRNFTAVNNAYIDAARWVEAQVPPNASVVTLGVTLTMQHRTDLNTSDIYLHDPGSLAEMLDDPLPFFLFLDLENINSQWQGLSPEQNFTWLQENSQLTQIGTHPPYTLFELTATP